MVLWREVTSPSCRDLPPFVGKPSVILGKLIWKRASNTQKGANYENSSCILTSGAHKQALIDDEASQPQLKIMHLIISGSLFIWVKNGFHCR